MAIYDPARHLNSYFTNLLQLGLVFDNTTGYIPFGDNDDLLNRSIAEQSQWKSQHRFFTKTLVDFIALYNELNSHITIDIISCNYNHPDFIREVKMMSKLYPCVTIRYSINRTGNLSDADWILESHQINIRDTYFVSELLCGWRHNLYSGIMSETMFAITPIGTVVGCGQNNTGDNTNFLGGQTTVSCRTTFGDVAELTAYNGVQIITVISNENNVYALDTAGRIYTWGNWVEKDYAAAAFQRPANNLIQPINNGEKMTRIACGGASIYKSAHFYSIDMEGHMYFAGSSCIGGDGGAWRCDVDLRNLDANNRVIVPKLTRMSLFYDVVKSDTLETHYKIPIARPPRFRDIVASPLMTAAITVDGDLFVWGVSHRRMFNTGIENVRASANTDALLSPMETRRFIMNPYMANIIPPTKIATNVASVALLDMAIVYSSTSGDVYSVGYNAYGQLGIGDGITMNDVFKRYIPDDNIYCFEYGAEYNWDDTQKQAFNCVLTFFNKLSGISNVISVHGAGNHVIAIDNQSRVFHWGAINNQHILCTPMLIDDLKACEAYSLRGLSAYIVGTDNGLHVMGRNAMGQLGLGDNNDRFSVDNYCRVPDIEVWNISRPRLAYNGASIGLITGCDRNTRSVIQGGEPLAPTKTPMTVVYGDCAFSYVVGDLNSEYMGYNQQNLGIIAIRYDRSSSNANNIGETMRVSVYFSDAVIVKGASMPYIVFNNIEDLRADYVSGSGTSVLVFEHMIVTTSQLMISQIVVNPIRNFLSPTYVAIKSAYTSNDADLTIPVMKINGGNMVGHGIGAIVTDVSVNMNIMTVTFDEPIRVYGKPSVVQRETDAIMIYYSHTENSVSFVLPRDYIEFDKMNKPILYFHSSNGIIQSAYSGYIVNQWFRYAL